MSSISNENFTDLQEFFNDFSHNRYYRHSAGNTNVTFSGRQNINQHQDEQILIVDDFYIWIFLATFGAIGIIFNILIIFALFRAKCNGARYYLLQLAFCDIMSLSICGLELFYMNHQKWIMQSELCPVYLGMESFTSTASSYFIIALNLHALSIYKLTMDTIERRHLAEHEYIQIEPDPGGDNDGCESSVDFRRRRTVTIDYSRRQRGIPVVLPALFIWFIGASMAIPLFVFGNVLPGEMDPSICGVMNFDKQSNYLMQTFMGIIRILLPVIGLHASMVCIMLKLRAAKDRIEPVALDENAVDVLKLAILVATTFAIFGMQKIYGSLFFELISKPFMRHKYPVMDRTVGLTFSLISCILPALRPVMYFIMDRSIICDSLRCWKCRRRSVRRNPVSLF